MPVIIDKNNITPQQSQNIGTINTKVRIAPTIEVIALFILFYIKKTFTLITKSLFIIYHIFPFCISHYISLVRAMV